MIALAFGDDGGGSNEILILLGVGRMNWLSSIDSVIGRTVSFTFALIVSTPSLIFEVKLYLFLKHI